MSTSLDQLYSLRNSFSVIGLTGRTGSGCSELAEMLSKKFVEIDNIRPFDNIEDSVFQRKYKISYNFTKANWKVYDTIYYKKVVFFMLLSKINKENIYEYLFDYYRTRDNAAPPEQLIESLEKSINSLLENYNSLIDEIIQLDEIGDIKDEYKLKKLNDLFWGESFDSFSIKIDEILKSSGVAERIMLLHHTASNFRRSGQPFKSEAEDPEHIYTIAKVINRIIKATKLVSKTGCHIVIDSLRNSLEINFFKERYSAFYLIAVKSDRRRAALANTYKIYSDASIERLLEIDEMEYRSPYFQNGLFYAPDVQNCIQIADYHINNNDLSFPDVIKTKAFYSLGEQLMKLQALIQQPGLIAPEPIERSMQLAYTAKLNSGCISRQVGAVVTDDEYSTKAVGWNDVPKGTIPCSLRNVKDLSDPAKRFGFTQFELGEGIQESEIDVESKQFNEFVKHEFSESKLPIGKLGGRNCPYCFKTAYNSFSGEKNQVHTRSLHAEENAMMQISKYGGQGLKNGYLFTTASPCELCAKKAYQLGITTIYYIDPYPGISRNHILKSMEGKDPEMVLFSGAVGRAYHKLYEPFLSQKDELALLTKFTLNGPEKVKEKALSALLKDSYGQNEEPEFDRQLQELLKEGNLVDRLREVLKKGLKQENLASSELGAQD